MHRPLPEYERYRSKGMLLPEQYAWPAVKARHRFMQYFHKFSGGPQCLRSQASPLKEIDDQIERDQGARFRGFLKDLLPKMDDAYRGEEDAFRSHLGASQIGRECDRQLWLGFRWAKRARFDGRILRLFNRGHLEEARFVAMLKCIGCEVWYEKPDGGQFKISRHSGHYGSAVDCFLRGIPEMPDTPMLGRVQDSRRQVLRQGDEGRGREEQARALRPDAAVYGSLQYRPWSLHGGE